MLLNESATFDVAQRIHTSPGSTLAEVFSFLSGLYFRGKIVYSRKFARPHSKMSGIYVITAGLGLQPEDMQIRVADLHAFANVPIDLDEPRYRDPLERDVQMLADQLPSEARVILLGSIATNKYVEVLSAALGKRLLFPKEFVGRGDMSRGGLMLRCVDDNQELEYIPVLGAVRHGTRPSRLPKRD